MQNKILVCTNLIGDSLYLLGPVSKYIETFSGEFSAIVVQLGIAGELFQRQFRTVYMYFDEADAKEQFPDSDFLRLEAGSAATICYENAQKTGKQLHISEGYAKLLGVDLEGAITPPSDWQFYAGSEFPKEYALICPFSRSCSRHTGERPNKTLDDWKWEPIIRWLRRHDLHVKVAAGPNDRLKQCSIPETDYLTADSLRELEEIIRKAYLVISVDNGLCHLASSIGAKTIVLWPEVSNIDFIAPCWSPSTVLLQIGNPNDVIAAQILAGLRKMTPYLESGQI